MLLHGVRRAALPQVWVAESLQIRQRVLVMYLLIYVVMSQIYGDAFATEIITMKDVWFQHQDRFCVQFLTRTIILLLLLLFDIKFLLLNLRERERGDANACNQQEGIYSITELLIFFRTTELLMYLNY